MTLPLPPRRLFSASLVLGSRPGSVGVGVAGCPGAAWVWSARVRTAPVSLALAVPAGACPRAACAWVRTLAPACTVSRRLHAGRWFLRVRGPVATLSWLADHHSAGHFGGARAASRRRRPQPVTAFRLAPYPPSPRSLPGASA